MQGIYETSLRAAKPTKWNYAISHNEITKHELDNDWSEVCPRQFCTRVPSEKLHHAKSHGESCLPSES